MRGVLNETTRTVHKHEAGGSDFETECGATHRLSPDNLNVVSVTSASSATGVDRCGRCFDDAGGY